MENQLIELKNIVSEIIKEKGLKQSEIATILGISQPKVSHLLCKKNDIFSMYSLMQIINKLGFDIQINISPAQEDRGKASIKICGEE